MIAERRGLDGFTDDLARQRTYFQGRSAVLEQVVGHLYDVFSEASRDARLAKVRDRLTEAWKPRHFPAAYDRPLLLLACLRLDAMTDGERHPLWSALAAAAPDPERATRSAVIQSMDPMRWKFWENVAHRAVQTNETSRAVAWLWPALLAGCSNGERALALVDIGASAGLNLVADEVPAVWKRDDGSNLAIAQAVRTTVRLGLDAKPVSLADPDSVAWLRACVWAGDAERIARLDAAIEAFRHPANSERPPRVETSQAHGVPARLRSLSAVQPPGGLVLAFQTVMRQYLDSASSAAYESGMREWLASLAPGRGLWVELESAADGDGAYPASIVAHLHAGSGQIQSLLLGRCEYHPRVVKVNDANADALSVLARA